MKLLKIFELGVDSFKLIFIPIIDCQSQYDFFSLLVVNHNFLFALSRIKFEQILVRLIIKLIFLRS